MNRCFRRSSEVRWGTRRPLDEADMKLNGIVFKSDSVQEVRSATGNMVRRVSVQCKLRPQRACLIVSTDDGYAVLRVARGKDEHATRYDVHQALVR